MSKPLKSDEIVVRRAREADAAAMADYMAALTAERLDTITPRERPASRTSATGCYRRHFAERGMILLAVVGDEVVGILDFWGGERPDNRHAGSFRHVGGQGLARPRGGAALLQAAIDEARGWPGFCRLELECVAWNDHAIGLYESLGFMIEGRMVKAINLRGKPEDMLVMALTW